MNLANVLPSFLFQPKREEEEEESFKARVEVRKTAEPKQLEPRGRRRSLSGLSSIIASAGAGAEIQSAQVSGERGTCTIIPLRKHKRDLSHLSGTSVWVKKSHNYDVQQISKAFFQEHTLPNVTWGATELKYHI